MNIFKHLYIKELSGFFTKKKRNPQKKFRCGLKTKNMCKHIILSTLEKGQGYFY